MDTLIINKIEKILSQSRFRAQLAFQNDMQTLYKKYPDLLELENKKRLITSDFKLDKKEKQKNLEELENSILVFIERNGISLPSITYNCNICNDTGYVNTDNNQVRCSCFTKMLVEEAMKDGNNSTIFTFDDFNEKLFDGAIKNQMLQIRDYLKAYAQNFPDVKKPNTVLYGNTGTGKTFLLSCLHSELKRNGIGSVYITAGKLFDYLRKYAFNQINDIDPLIEAELLIIDDIGTEPLFNNITVEYMFLLINERAQNKKPICISTNLSPAEIKSRYTERIASRVLDKSTTSIIQIPGNDLRLRL